MTKATIKTYLPILYLIFLMLPIYSIVMTSFKTEFEIKHEITPFPILGTLSHYEAIFSDSQAYGALINTIIYVVLNNLFTLLVAVPAAYAFSRYRFIGDHYFFFWFLVSRMTPPAAVAIPLVQFYSSLGLAVDGYSSFGFFRRILLPMIAPGIGVTAFFCFIFSWVEILLANWITTINAVPFGSIILRAGTSLGLNSLGWVSATAVLSIIPGLLLVYFVRNHLAKGFSMGQTK